MTAHSNITISKRVIVLFVIALLVLSAFNIYLIVERLSAGSGVTPYEFVISKNGNSYQLKNTVSGSTTESDSASSALNSAFTQGNSVYLNAGTYTLNQDVLIANKTNAKLIGNEATIIGNDKKIIISGGTYTDSMHNSISGLTIINGTVRIENSFGTTISSMIFENTSIGIELANTRSWSENTQIENCYFINATEGIAFRTPLANATGSYASTEINRSFFNLRDDSIGINVEPLAELSDSQIQDVRIWTGQDGHANQTGLLLDGTMHQSLLIGVVFESFTVTPNTMYAIDIGQTANTAPIMNGGVSFLGNWTAMVHNPKGVWISGVGSAFERQGINVPVGLNGQYGSNVTIETLPLKIFNFVPKISATGTFAPNEIIIVRIRIAYVDNFVSNGVIKTFNSTSAVWLNNDDMMQLYPSQDVIWGIIIDAQSSSSSTNTTVTVSGYGTAG